jgi:hypothetical protein
MDALVIVALPCSATGLIMMLSYIGGYWTSILLPLGIGIIASSLIGAFYYKRGRPRNKRVKLRNRPIKKILPAIRSTEG